MIWAKRRCTMQLSTVDTMTMNDSRNKINYDHNQFFDSFFLGQANVTELLRRHGADINIRDKKGKTASESTAELNTYCILC